MTTSNTKISRRTRIARLLVDTGRLFFRRFGYIAIFAVSLYIVGYISQLAYYRFMPGRWFLGVSAARVSDAQVSEELSLTLCRTTRYPNIKGASTRSFYQYLDGGKLSPAGDYEFTATYESDKNCQVIHIPASKHPEKAGDYYIHTDITFIVYEGSHGFKKVVSYDTNRFHIYDTTRSLRQQIQDLQSQLDALRAELSITDRGPKPSNTEPDIAGRSKPTSATAPTSKKPPAPSNATGGSATAQTNPASPPSSDSQSLPDQIPGLGGVLRLIGL